MGGSKKPKKVLSAYVIYEWYLKTKQQNDSLGDLVLGHLTLMADPFAY